MPRYRLRTLLIVLALGPPVLAGAWAMIPVVSRWLWPPEPPQVIWLIDR